MNQINLKNKAKKKERERQGHGESILSLISPQMMSKIETKQWSTFTFLSKAI